MSSSSISLYIPSIKISYTSDRVIYLFWKHGFGKVDRVDFVPIIKANDKECIHFKRAFLYVDPKSAWHPNIVKSIEQGTPYKVYPNKDETFEHFKDEKEYWLILKNKSPVPYATTCLNIHQLVNNVSELEAQLAEREAQLAEREAQLAEREAQLAEREAQLAEREAQIAERKTLVTELTAVNTRLSEFNRNPLVENNDTDENTENIKAYNFVNSLDNILHMMKKAHNEYNGYIESEEVDYEEDDHYEEYSLSDRFNDEIDGMVQDGDDDDDEKIMCNCDICGEKKILTAYGWRAADEKLCSECFLSAPMN
jgi:hypothetical protein